MLMTFEIQIEKNLRDRKVFSLWTNPHCVLYAKFWLNPLNTLILSNKNSKV